MQNKQPSLSISTETLLTLMTTLGGGSRGREDDEHPLPPGPWDPVIRSALERTGVYRFGDEVALNPQPLPPRYRFLAAMAQTVIGRAELFQDLAQTMPAGSQQGIIIVGGYVDRFSDELCGTTYKLRWPFPGPRPKWFAQELDATDLVWLGAQFGHAAGETFSPELRRNLAGASAKFVAAGLSKLQ